MNSKEKRRLDDHPDIIVGLEAAAKVLGVTKGRVGQLIQEGKLKAYDVGSGKQRGQWIFYREDLEAVLELEQTPRGRKFRGSIDEHYVSPLEAASLLEVDYDEVMYLVERGELQAPFMVKRHDRTVVRILSSSVQELLERRRFVMAHEPLNTPLLELWQVAEVLNIDVKTVRRLAKEGKLLMRNITSNEKYELWRIVTSSLKQYMLAQAELHSTYFTSLKQAANALGICKERVRQLIGEGKLEAMAMSSSGTVNARRFISRESVQQLRESRRQDL